jgi:hypothetical protein
MKPAEDTIRRISPQSGRRRFLKQLAAGVAVGAQAFPAVAEEKAERAAAAGDQVTLAETLARYAAGLKYEDLPDDVVRIAKRSILDTVGCAFGGYRRGRAGLHKSSRATSVRSKARPFCSAASAPAPILRCSPMA